MIEMTEDPRDQKLYMSEIIILAGIMGYSSLPGIMDAGVLGKRRIKYSPGEKCIYQAGDLSQSQDDRRM